jgi:predicted RNA-binding Zn-ribbon protein involved in translation (DUF1610 family)
VIFTEQTFGVRRSRPSTLAKKICLKCDYDMVEKAFIGRETLLVFECEKCGFWRTRRTNNMYYGHLNKGTETYFRVPRGCLLVAEGKLK